MARAARTTQPRPAPADPEAAWAERADTEPSPEPTQGEYDQPVPDHRTAPPPSGVPAIGDPQSRPRPATHPRPLLWREAVGHQLRTERHEQGRTQGDVASVAGVSTQYLSEVERGRKEPSSEILEAIGSSLGLELAELAGRVSRSLAASTPVLLAA
ncbi:helix-turn-helix transcriptional regulator [Ruania sp. N2-46]|uniref:Helix-turn-helix transcriptional regulator n=2 Tax=Occultella gossypii TaxID=2800820 RepID=A0ABS7S3W6_9MICO|nr:helix-turn-helix transcriptional regulator [Occultella gossypii]